MTERQQREIYHFRPNRQGKSLKLGPVRTFVVPGPLPPLLNTRFSMTTVTRLLVFAALAAAASGSIHAQTESASVSLSVETTADSPSERSFGGELSLDRDGAVDLKRALTDTALHGRPILLRGSVADVCSRKGCWMILGEGEEQMRVTFKDYSFFLPTDSHGHIVLIEGIVSAVELSEEDALHYAEESTTGMNSSQEISGPRQVISMEAVAVVLDPVE